MARRRERVEFRYNRGACWLLVGMLIGCGSKDGDDESGGDGASGGSSASGDTTSSGTQGAGGGGSTASNVNTSAGSEGTTTTTGATTSNMMTANSTSGSGTGTGTGTSGGGGLGPGTGSAAEAAEKLGREPNFLIGMGNDLAQDHNEDGAYTLGVTLDIHYAYLVGLPGEGGWPDWNAGGTFVNILTDTADAHGVTPMFDLYTMASRGEANLDPLADDGFMGVYWETLLLLYERLADFGKPAIVHFEPDFWAFAQQQAGGDPSSIPVRVSSLVDECSSEPDDLVGFGHCILLLGRKYAPKVLLGFHASAWAGATPDTVEFLNAVGAGSSDFIGMDMLDRDAGCFEEHVDEACQRDDGPWYWDETNQTSPNFHEYLAYSKEISDGLGVPIIWWQIPFGVPSDTPGGEPGAYRDNRVHYIFGHIDEFIDAGGLAAVFGVGAGNQTYITTDGNQFKDAVTSYFADPVPLP